MQKHIIALMAFLSVLSMQAQAALPTEATAAFTSLETDTTTLLGLVWSAVAAVTVGWVLIKLFKKGANKAV